MLSLNVPKVRNYFILVQKARVEEIMGDIKKRGVDFAMEKMKASVKMPLGMKVF